MNSNDLLKLHHNDHTAAFLIYLKGLNHKEGKGSKISVYRVMQRAKFLLRFVNPTISDVILECGSSGGKTCVDFAKRSGCTMIGIDFDPKAIQISTELQQKYFPELNKKITFVCADLQIMKFDKKITKIIMPDFTEHIPDEVFKNILVNIKQQLPHVPIYIFTPVRTHFLEILKHRNLLIKNPSGHINVKTEKEMVNFLEKNGWKITTKIWEPAYIQCYKYIDLILGHLPFIGKHFHRKMAIIAQSKN